MALPTLAPSDPTESEPSGRPQPKREHILLAAVAVVALLAGGWFFFLRSSGTDTPTPPVVHKPIVHATGAAGATAAAKPGTAGATAAAKPGAKPAVATTAPVSELAAYVGKANAICTAANTKIAALDSSDISVKGRIALLNQTLPLMNGEVAALRALDVPAGHPEFAKLWDQQHQIASLTHQIRGALNDGNPNTVVQLTAWMVQDEKTLNTAYTSAGLTGCSVS